MSLKFPVIGRIMSSGRAYSADPLIRISVGAGVCESATRNASSNFAWSLGERSANLPCAREIRDGGTASAAAFAPAMRPSPKTLNTP